MEEQVLAHFRLVDPVLYSLVKKVSLQKLSKRPPAKYFQSLCHEIIGQQLSGRVADVIYDRFEKLFPKWRVTPKGVLRFSEKRLRATGMSWSKARFTRDLAQKVFSTSVQLAQ